MLGDTVAKLEADVGAVVETEDVAQLRVEAVVAQILVEPVGSVVGRLIVTKSGSSGRSFAWSSSSDEGAGDWAAASDGGAGGCA
jgi:hypothetical protein